MAVYSSILISNIYFDFISTVFTFNFFATLDLAKAVNNSLPTWISRQQQSNSTNDSNMPPNGETYQSSFVLAQIRKAFAQSEIQKPRKLNSTSRVKTSTSHSTKTRQAKSFSIKKEKKKVAENRKKPADLSKMKNDKLKTGPKALQGKRQRNDTCQYCGKVGLCSVPALLKECLFFHLWDCSKLF